MLNARGAVRLAKFFASPTTAIGDMGDTIQGEWIAVGASPHLGQLPHHGRHAAPGQQRMEHERPWGSLETSTGARVVWGVAARRQHRVEHWQATTTSCGAPAPTTTSSGARCGDDNIVWSTGGDDNIVWSTGGDDNIVWSTGGDDNIVWSTRW